MAAGAAAARFDDTKLRNISCDQIEADEIWNFIGCKQRNLSDWERNQSERGANWTWIAVCARIRLIVSWIMGRRDGDHAEAFMFDVAARIDRSVKPHVSTDALS
jgi:hypothetical protein